MRSKPILAVLITAALLFVNPDNSFAASKKPAPKPKTQAFLVVDIFSEYFQQVPFQEQDLEGNYKTFKECGNTNRYSDLVKGAQVIIENEKSIVIAKGKMIWNTQFNFGEDGTVCNLQALITKIPISKFYKIKVGSKNSMTYSHNELVQQSWRVALEW